MIEAKKLAYEDRAQLLRRPGLRPRAGQRADLQALCRPAASARSIRGEANQHPTPGRAAAGRHDLSDRGRQGPQLRQPDPEQLPRLRLVPRAGRPGLSRFRTAAACSPSTRTHANRLEPRKRPFHTIIPGFVTKDGKPWLSFGLMGGDMQAQGHAQVLCNMIDFGMDVQEAGDAPRFRHFGSSEPTGQPAEGGGSVALESGISAEVRSVAASQGASSGRRSPGGFGGYQAIRIDLEHGVLIGGSDPRKDGCAMGY